MADMITTLSPSARLQILMDALSDADALRSTSAAAGYGDEYDALLKGCLDVFDAIAAEPVGSLGDLGLKATAFLWSAALLDDEPYHNPSKAEQQIVRQIMHGLVGMISTTRVSP